MSQPLRKFNSVGASLSWKLLETAGALVLFTSSPSEAVSGRDLVAECNATYPNHEIVISMYIAGVFEAALAFVDQKSDQAFCVPKGTTSKQVADLVCDIVRRNPRASNDIPAPYMISAVLQQSFPCKNKAN